MGCDIHMLVEVRQGGEWVTAPEKRVKARVGDYQYTEPYYAYTGRNYDLFGILAGVRNGRGFAGIPTGRGFNSISEPKGVPKDASPEYKKLVRDWDGDGHSHSYLTLRELLDFDWEQETVRYGVMSVGEYEKWIEARKSDPTAWPESFCGSVRGPNVEVMGQAEYLKRKNAGTLHSEVYVEAEWGTKYGDAAGHFVETTMKRLPELGDPDDVRIVFFFDN